MDYQKWLNGDSCSCANNFIHIESADCKKKDVCDCENILLELSKQHTDDLTLQDEIDYVSGAVDTVSGEVDNKLDASAYTPTDLSDYYTKEEVNDIADEKLDASAYTPVDLSDYYTKEDVNNIADTKLDESAYTPTDLSDYYTKEQVDALIPEVPSLSGYATEQWVLDKHYITGVDLSDYVLNSELVQYITNLQEQINSLTSAISGCCGQTGETTYRWITMTGDNDYWCSGTTKMSKEKEQSSTDGINWTDTGNIRSGSTILEENCIDCGYVPPTTGKKYSVITTANTEYDVDCCEEADCNELVAHDVIIGGRTGMIKTINVGECITIMGTSVFMSESGMTDVVLPSTIAYIRDVLLTGCTSMQTLTLLGATPPTFVSSMHNISRCGLFDVEKDPSEPPEVIPTGFKIKVPSGAVNTYKAAPVWSRYSSYIESI